MLFSMSAFVMINCNNDIIDDFECLNFVFIVGHKFTNYLKNAIRIFNQFFDDNNLTFDVGEYKLSIIIEK